MGRFHWQCNSRWSGAWLYAVMGANQFVFLLVFGVRKPWFQPVAYCWGVFLLTPGLELVSDGEGSTPAPWVSARLPWFSSLVCWACFSFPPPQDAPSTKSGSLRGDSDSSVFHKDLSCPRLALSVKHPYTHSYTPIKHLYKHPRADVGAESALTSWWYFWGLLSKKYFPLLWLEDKTFWHYRYDGCCLYLDR